MALLFQVKPAPKVILFFGDSLTAGYGLSTEEAFPALIEKELNKNGNLVKIVNAGLTGSCNSQSTYLSWSSAAMTVCVGYPWIRQERTCKPSWTK